MEHFVVDRPIMLDVIKTRDLYHKTLTVLKMKGTNHGKSVYLVEISDDDMSVYPSQHVF